MIPAITSLLVVCAIIFVLGLFSAHSVARKKMPVETKIPQSQRKDFIITKSEELGGISLPSSNVGNAPKAWQQVTSTGQQVGQLSGIGQ